MSLSIVQYGSSANTWVTSGTAQTPFTSNTTPGNAVLLMIKVLDEPPGTVTAVTSPIGSFDYIGSGYDDAGSDVEWWLCTGVTGAAKSVTVSCGSGNDYGVVAWEIHGGITSGVYGSSASGSNNTTDGQTATLTGITVGQFVFVFFAMNEEIATGPSSPWSDYGIEGVAGDIVAFSNGADAAWMVATATSASATWTWTYPTVQWAYVSVYLNGPVAPTVSSEAAVSYGGVELLSALVNNGGESTTVSFNYGPTSSYGSSTGSVVVLASSTVWIGAVGLTAGDTYHYQCVATNSIGTAYGSDATFTAVGMPSFIGGGLGYGAMGGSGVGEQPAVPYLSGIMALSYGPSIEVLSVDVASGDAGTTVYFKYGLTTSYGTDTSTITITSGQTLVNQPLTGLTVNDTYHFQVVVTNPVGTALVPTPRSRPPAFPVTRGGKGGLGIHPYRPMGGLAMQYRTTNPDDQYHANRRLVQVV